MLDSRNRVEATVSYMKDLVLESIQKMHPVALQFILFFCALLLFHFSEFVFALIIHGKSNVNRRSFLISKQYILALLCGIIEYAIESTLFPKVKSAWWVRDVGIAMIVSGELLRKGAILTACRGFTHDIKISHQDDHELVTHGIYSIMRHPGYAGFFIWSVGTQVFLCNPVCAVAYAIVLWRFFDNRVRFEEHYLRQFFGVRYVEYSRKVPCGIPFIK